MVRFVAPSISASPPEPDLLLYLSVPCVLLATLMKVHYFYYIGALIALAAWSTCPYGGANYQQISSLVMMTVMATTMPILHSRNPSQQGDAAPNQP